MVRDKNLAKSYHNQPCVVCSGTPCDPDHILPLGMGGNKNRDAEWNIWALCRKDHREKHDLGLTRFVEKHRLWWILKDMGFYQLDNGKWWHSEAARWHKI